MSRPAKTCRCTYTEVYWKVDLHDCCTSPARLRMDGYAQCVEIRRYATTLGEKIHTVAPLFPMVWKRSSTTAATSAHLSRPRAGRIQRLAAQGPASG